MYWFERRGLAEVEEMPMLDGFRLVGRPWKSEFRCNGCDVRAEWEFAVGLYVYKDQYCPGCSSLLRWLARDLFEPNQLIQWRFHDDFFHKYPALYNMFKARELRP